ncbi:MAG TPA: hypothetical protein VNU46_01575 [Gemmatimonadaceae bacterium]|jgi:hypothetical protein|nr:hypothetical protein [Gemmatimonadaceae bacterium]
MQLRQFNELDAARRALTFLTTTPPAAPLAAMPATFTTQVQTLGTTITQIDAQASAQTSATGAIKDKASAAKAAATELRSSHLVPIKKVAKLLAKGSTGASLSPNFASSITIPHDHNYQALLAAASATVQNVTPYKDLFIARGLPTDFLDQLTAQATVLSQAISATGTAKTTRVASTVDILQLMHELRSTMHVLDINVTKACKADRVNGPTTLAGWKAAKTVRKGATTTDIPFAPTPTTASTPASTSAKLTTSASSPSSATTTSAVTPGATNG